MDIRLPDTVHQPGILTVVVCGGREFRAEDALIEVLDRIDDECQKRNLRLIIVQGGAPGADKIARTWAAVNEVELYNEPADWRRWGRAAGPRRNQRIVDAYYPDLCIAMPGGKGTLDMMNRCRDAKIPVWTNSGG